MADTISPKSQFYNRKYMLPLPKHQLYTWKSPKDGKNNLIRNQINYILINRTYRNSVKLVKTYPGADVNTDHILLVAKSEG